MSKIEYTPSRVPELEGQLLTIIDAIVSDPVQRKAAKDLFKRTLWDWNNYASPTFIVTSDTESLLKNP